MNFFYECNPNVLDWTNCLTVDWVDPYSGIVYKSTHIRKRKGKPVKKDLKWLSEFPDFKNCKVRFNNSWYFADSLV